MLTDAIHYMDNCIFVDECGLNACMVSGRVRSKRGKRSHVITETKRAMDISIISALSSTRIESIETKNLPGGTNAVIFDEFLENLFKILQDRYLGEKKYIVMDNVSFHRSSIIKQKFESSIHEAYFLPPYSPMFNSIESCFNKLKNFVKRSPRTKKRTCSI